MIYQGDGAHRLAYIKGLRDLADWLEANEDVPVTSGTHALQISLYGTDEQQQQDLMDVAAAFGTAPVDSFGTGTHFEVGREFGPLKYFVNHSTAAWSADFREEQRLGKAAMAAQRAAERQDEADWEAYADCVDCVDCLTPDAVEVLRAVAS